MGKQAGTMDKIVALCRRRGFIFGSSEIYGGIGGFWDYGPLGTELKRNIKDAWWNDMVHNPPPRRYLDANPDLATLEVLSPDMNGMLRAKRIPRSEVDTFFDGRLTAPGTTQLMNSLGDNQLEDGIGTVDGDPDKGIHPVSRTLAPIPWLRSATHQGVAAPPS